ncbi:pre-mRNA-splicing factor syf2-like [Homarus americanus]|uniref:Pre-mRNA-splicing factor SYF2 n=1 Tax=Homarus americanus TaxID=6706 RepID=A0A8J5NCY3_HOMAM|nr:pre-mRNA-splicing factor syf2-like [Homarus americanus]KAG7177353.1 Pre-mRNA-splicing factor syf2-like [Homarus americanus]
MAQVSSSTGSSSKTNKMADFKARLAKLHSKRNEAAALNHKEVVEEDRVKKMPKNYAKKRERLESEFKEEQKREAALAEGKDYDRQKLLDVGADEAERWERRKKKKNPDQGFSTYEDATIRQYNRLVKNKKTDMVDYEREKQALGEAAFYGEDNTISIGLHKDSNEAIDSMVDDLEKQIAKREKYSRRRIFDDDADINFINERNMKFNKKLERFYGDYTEEIKQNLERGTAV